MDVKIGLAGITGMGSTRYSTLKNIEGVKIVGGFDLPQKKEIAEEYGIKFYPDFEEMLEEVDAVTISLPNYLHLEYTLRALEKDKHVLVEYPMATSVKEGKEMIKKAKEKNKVLHVGLTDRLEPWFLKFKEIKNEKKFIILTIYSQWSGGGKNWHEKPDLTGGIFLLLHHHRISQYMDLLGYPRIIFSRKFSLPSSPPQLGHCELEFPGGIVVTLNWHLVTRLPKAPPADYIFTSQGVYIFREPPPQLTFFQEGKEIEIPLPAPKRQAYELDSRNFIKEIKGSPPLFPPEEALQVLEVCEKLQKWED